MKSRIRQLRQGASYHVICKINRDEIIFDDDAITTLLLMIIMRCKKRYSFSVETFCIMGNHVHFIIRPGKHASLPRIMQWLNSVFAKTYNKKMGISGRLWKERYFSRIIKTARLFEIIFEYIMKNPLKANLVKHAKDYRWSGLYHYLHKIQGIIDLQRKFIRNLYEQYQFL